ncbi:MAG: hypothetical protein ACP5VS_18895 [Desulfomonilaceae bacterium]
MANPIKCVYCGAWLTELAMGAILTPFKSHPVYCPNCSKELYLNTEVTISVTTEPTLPIMPGVRS